ncbi:HWE histidine kinase domain-containing protein [Pelagibacterium sp.]|uniref:HWE histidine kinase domain-containing protein n=1 Tax=Pelagibacterium sp. TaxID=1967288 RepID=UPI003A8D85EB
MNQYASTGTPLENGVDLTNCDREPIHRLGRIQGFGFLVAVSFDWIVQYVSANSAEWLGVDADAAIGRPLGNFADAEFLHTIRNHVQHLTGPDDVERVFGVRLTAGGQNCDTAVHVSGSLIIIECEPARPGGEDNDSMVRRIVQRLQAAETVERLCKTGASLVQALTGFDRVMIYKFLHDDSGEVVAESRRQGVDSFMGLRYPASDIPRQARELYKRNLIRIIADVDGQSHDITPFVAPDGMPIDLSNSVLRSVSPIHLEYLRNMGVGASMSISILLRGRLWGLIACHHYSPRRVPFNVRTAAELVGQMFSLALDAKVRESEIDAERRAQEFHHKVLRMVGPEQGPVSQLASVFEEMSGLVACDGIGMIVDEEVELWEETPNRAQFGELVHFLNRTASNSIFVTHELSTLHPSAKAYAPTASGMLVIPISRTPRDYLIFFRREVTQEVKWAGNPEKPVTMGPMGARLTPRKSFEIWQETSRGQSEPWSSSHIRLAETLRVSLLEVILKHTDLIEGERKMARQRQELLIAELNHRVRNILGLMRGLIRQVNTPHRSTEVFVSTLDHRVQALARAHDQLTERQWGSGSLRQLIHNETAAYLAEKSERVVVSGDDVGLVPQSFSALALVIHELTTNSAKYGALCDKRGTVAISLERDDAGWLTIRWVERDGPAVKPPSDSGFGSVVIERSVSHDLGGSAEMDFRIDGLRAKLRIAPEHLADLDHQQPDLPRQAVRRAGAVDFPQGKALVVEDNVIIAMDCEAVLRDLGCRDVALASSVSQALKVIENSEIGFAVLDVNLGNETSFAVADVLGEKAIPFIFASGYADGVSFPDAHVDRPKVSKPYDMASLTEALEQVF